VTAAVLERIVPLLGMRPALVDGPAQVAAIATGGQ
jgi:hypothetical protein